LKILFDTNIILDVLLNRQPFVDLSAGLLSLAENRTIDAYLCATSITTIDYLLSKSTSRQQSKVEMQKLLKIFQISEVNAAVIDLAIKSTFKDFEDAVQYFSGDYCEVNGLVTRNIKDYQQAEYPVYSPKELWSLVTREMQ